MNQYSYIDFKFQQGNGQMWLLLRGFPERSRLAQPKGASWCGCLKCPVTAVWGLALTRLLWRHGSVFRKWLHLSSFCLGYTTKGKLCVVCRDIFKLEGKMGLEGLTRINLMTTWRRWTGAWRLTAGEPYTHLTGWVLRSNSHAALKLPHNCLKFCYSCWKLFRRGHFQSNSPPHCHPPRGKLAEFYSRLDLSCLCPRKESTSAFPVDYFINVSLSSCLSFCYTCN